MRYFKLNDNVYKLADDQITEDEKSAKVAEASSALRSALELLNSVEEGSDNFASVNADYDVALSNCESVKNIKVSAPSGVVEITDEEQIESIDNPAPSLGDQIALVKSECTSRIFSVWPSEQQWNALAGVSGYGDEDLENCKAWVDKCRACRDALLSDEVALMGIDVTDDQFWPEFLE